jgi:hypothetical protein
VTPRGSTVDLLTRRGNLAPEGDDAARSTGDPAHDHVVEAGVTDLREVAAAEPAQVAEDVVRVPAAVDMTASRVQADQAVAASECATANARPTRRMRQPQPRDCARDAAGEWVLRRRAPRRAHPPRG